MRSHGIAVEKRIPSFAGLGGGSSDAATYLKMCNEVLHLGLTADELSAIGSKVGADVAFFIHNYPSANVSGIGEIVEPFDEEPLPLEIITPKIKISTPDVYRRFRENFYTELDTEEAARLSRMDSKTILQNYSISEANDLFEPAVSLYPELKSAYKHGWFFSGSGSSFFKIKDKDYTNEASA
jgi:4-diphosphocytidyl-2-C-methyl-D-erythritol kinase